MAVQAVCLILDPTSVLQPATSAPGQKYLMTTRTHRAQQSQKRRNPLIASGSGCRNSAHRGGDRREGQAGVQGRGGHGGAGRGAGGPGGPPRGRGGGPEGLPGPRRQHARAEPRLPPHPGAPCPRRCGHGSRLRAHRSALPGCAAHSVQWHSCHRLHHMSQQHTCPRLCVSCAIVFALLFVTVGSLRGHGHANVQYLGPLFGRANQPHGPYMTAPIRHLLRMGHGTVGHTHCEC